MWLDWFFSGMFYFYFFGSTCRSKYDCAYRNYSRHGLLDGLDFGGGQAWSSGRWAGVIRWRFLTMALLVNCLSSGQN
jgi:hypothetical protein